MIDLMDGAVKVWSFDPWHNRELSNQIDELIKTLGSNASTYSDERRLFDIIQDAEKSNGSVYTIDFADASYDYSDDPWDGETYRALLEGTYEFKNRGGGLPRVELVLSALKKKGLLSFPDEGSMDYQVWW